MIGHAAVGAQQTVRLPLSATAAAAEIAASLDASHFGKCRPSTADRTVSLHPTHGFRQSPAAVAGVQEREWNKRDNSLERFRVRAKGSRDVFHAIVITAQRSFEQH